MSILTLDDARLHLRIDGSDDDALVQDCIDAADDYIAQYLGRDVPWLDDSGTPVAIPASVKQAAKLLVGDYYAVREASIIGKAVAENPAVAALLNFYRVGMGV